MTNYKMEQVSEMEMDIRNIRQETILRWCNLAFAQPNNDPDEVSIETRAIRAFEEMCELMQSLDIPFAMLIKQAVITYDRPIGDTHQELGGVMITMNALAEVIGDSLAAAEEDEITRCNAKDEGHFQKRQQEKRSQGL